VPTQTIERPRRTVPKETAEQTIKRIRTIGMKSRRGFTKDGDASFRADELGVTVELYGQGCGRSEYFNGEKMSEAVTKAYAWADAKKIKLHWIDRSTGHALSI
jgi:hypothetical protein